MDCLDSLSKWREAWLWPGLYGCGAIRSRRPEARSDQHMPNQDSLPEVVQPGQWLGHTFRGQPNSGQTTASDSRRFYRWGIRVAMPEALRLPDRTGST